MLRLSDLETRSVTAVDGLVPTLMRLVGQVKSWEDLKTHFFSYAMQNKINPMQSEAASLFAGCLQLPLFCSP